MSRKLTPFFATHADLVDIARQIAVARSVDFVQGGLFAEPKVAVLTDVDGLRKFETYLIVDSGVSVTPRVVLQRGGGQMYAVDQANNPQTIALQTGGKYGEHQLVAGQIGTVGKSTQSDELYAMFAKSIRKQFEKIKSFHVGPEAVAMLDAGVRLSATPKSPEAYDLVR
jgi:hypothetical protein